LVRERAERDGRGEGRWGNDPPENGKKSLEILLA
jgi:hypothetical protein